MADGKNKLQQAFIEYVESIRPDNDNHSAIEIEKAVFVKEDVRFS